MITMIIIMIIMMALTVGTTLILEKRNSKDFYLGLAKVSFKNGYATKKELEFLLKHSNNRDDKKNFLNREEQLQAKKELNWFGNN